MYITKEEVKAMKLEELEKVASNYKKSLKAIQAPRNEAEHDGIEIILKSLRTYETALLELLYDGYTITSIVTNKRYYEALENFTKLISDLLEKIV